MKTYAIVCTTDFYHASRDSRFPKHSNQFALQEGLTLKEAQEQLLRDFCEDAETWCPNWGIAVNTKNVPGVEAYRTAKDGTRRYSSDIYTYSIEEEKASDILRKVGGKEFSDLFVCDDDLVYFSNPFDDPSGALTDEELDLDTLVVKGKGKTKRFFSIREAAEYLYFLYQDSQDDSWQEC